MKTGNEQEKLRKITNTVTKKHMTVCQRLYCVPAEEAGLKGFRIDVYKIKPEFEKCFEVSEEELETERAAAEAERANEEARMEELLNQILSQVNNEE